MADWNFDGEFLFGVNLYGFTPCPRCGDEHRASFVSAPERLVCDHCGFQEPVRALCLECRDAVADRRKHFRHDYDNSELYCKACKAEIALGKYGPSPFYK